MPPAYRRDLAIIGLGGYGGCIVFDGCLGCGRMETYGLGVGGAMPNAPVLLLNGQRCFHCACWYP